MSSIALRIVLHGLIALVPTTDSNGVNHMTALLVNGLEPHGIDERCTSIHRPMLRFLAAETGECVDADCEISGNQCTCREMALTGKHISIDITPVPVSASQRLTSSPPINRLPTNKSEAASFSYIANLAQAPFGLSLNQEYLGAAPPEHLLARMKFPFNSITSCALAAREDGGDAHVHEMSYRKLHDPSLKTDTSQALAQRVITELAIPDGNGSEEPQVILRISNFGDPEMDGHKIRLLPGASGYRIEISNQPPRFLDRDDPCNDGVARHFAMFYELADGAIPLSERLLPHVRFATSVNRASIQPEVCNELVFALMDRPICPMATFNP